MRSMHAATHVTDGRELRDALRSRFRWLGDRTDDSGRADLTGWWSDPAVLTALGPALAQLFPGAQPTVVIGPQSRGTLLGALTATALGIGLVEARKDPGPAADSDAWLCRTSPPDYRDRHLELGFRRDLITSGARVLMVDDWVASGATALTVKALVDATGASWIGCATIVDAATDSRVRQDLGLRSLLHVRDLGWWR
jgi:adenine phosphoribosyltransferase